jgi:hypothetical protein
MCLQAIEVNYPMLISPIMLVPQALPKHALQSIFLETAHPIRVRSGPLRSQAEREANNQIPVHKFDFRKRTVLMAPPVITQERSLKSAGACSACCAKWVLCYVGECGVRC